MRNRVVQLSIVSILALAALAWGVNQIVSTWSSKPQSYRGQIRVGTPLDLDSPVALPGENKQPVDFDIAWSGEGGGSIVVPPGSPGRILALEHVRDQEGALAQAWENLNELRESTIAQLPAQQSRFVAVLTSRSNLAVVEIANADPQGAWLHWRLEMAYPPTFGSVETATLYVTDQSSPQAVCAIDLDTNQSLQIPSQTLDAGGQTLLEWLEQNGVDAVAITQGEELGLSGITLVFEPWPPSAWSGTEPSHLYVNLINFSQQLAEPMTFKARQYQPVYAFKTREGCLGELQILSVNKAAGSVTFRYRTLTPPTSSPMYSYVEVDAESDQLADSAKRLKHVGLFVQMYAGDHNGRLPDTLPELKAYVENEQDFRWIMDNVEYLGKGMTTVDPATQIVAYDRTLAKKGKGTNILYLDSSVAFKSSAEVDPESDQLASSVKRLKYVGLFVQMYAGDHDGRLPDSLPELKAYVENEQDFQWIVTNVEYLGKGMTTADPATQVIAYDRALAKKGKGTNVLYLEGSVAFKSPAELKEQGLFPRR